MCLRDSSTKTENSMITFVSFQTCMKKKKKFGIMLETNFGSHQVLSIWKSMGTETFWFTFFLHFYVLQKKEPYRLLNNYKINLFVLKQKYYKYNALSIMHYFSTDKMIHIFYFFSVLLQNYMYFTYKYSIIFTVCGKYYENQWG